MSRVMPSDMEDIQVQFCYLEGGEPAFICGAIGHVTSELLDILEKDVNGIPLKHTFEKGEGDYLFSAKFQVEQRGDFNRIEVPGYWLLELLEFRAYGDTTDMTEMCPLCEEGHLSPFVYADSFKYDGSEVHVEGLEASRCDACGGEPVMPDQVRCNHLRFMDARVNHRGGYAKTNETRV